MKFRTNNQRLAQLYVSFRINDKRFPFVTGLNEGEGSRNEDVNFKEKINESL